ncbi:MAG: alpha/beta hydrolase [Actinobacteria bacterium]|nr:alpha/beta hydrolase [Actinomycetota bacterium]
MHESKSDGIAFIAGRWPLDPDLPTMVFIHGSGGSNIMWRAQVETLSREMNTIALDLPGHGASEGEGMDCITGYAAIVDDFVASLCITQPVVCGLSIGGGIVLQLLLDMPQKYKAGIVVNSGARLRVMPLIFETLEKNFEGFINGSYTFSISEKTDPALVKPLVDSMAQCPPAITRGDFTACDTFDVMERLGEIEVPFLVIASADDKMTPVKYGTFMADHIENSTLVVIEDAGHLCPMEKPAEVSRAISEFVLPLFGKA